MGQITVDIGFTVVAFLLVVVGLVAASLGDDE